jgi:3-phosphoshikimate 1-carboxyvinyltransferase
MIRVTGSKEKIRTIIDLTPSKSITNRVLVIRELTEGKFDVYNESRSTDSEILKRILSNLPSVADAGDAGTAFRFLTAYLSLQQGSFTLTGSDRMKIRPVGKLVRALRETGASIEFAEKEDFPPLLIRGSKLKGGKIKIDASESSQFISALMLVAPLMENGLDLELTGKVYSRHYIVMTLSLMQFFGIRINTFGNTIQIPFQKYVPKAIRIENDWSSASFWYLTAALAPNAEVTIRNLFRESIQGDSDIVGIGGKFGVKTEYRNNEVLLITDPVRKLPEFFDYDFSNCPDLVLPVAALCAGLKIPAVLNGVKNLRIKESNRLMAIRSELEKTGAVIHVNEDSLVLEKFNQVENKFLFHSHNDHRMVMSLAPLALIYNEVFIDDHLPVNKSYPEFWLQFRSAGFSCDLV